MRVTRATSRAARTTATSTPAQTGTRPRPRRHRANRSPWWFSDGSAVASPTARPSGSAETDTGSGAPVARRLAMVIRLLVLPKCLTNGNSVGVPASGIAIAPLRTSPEGRSLLCRHGLQPPNKSINFTTKNCISAVPWLTSLEGVWRVPLCSLVPTDVVHDTVAVPVIYVGSVPQLFPGVANATSVLRGDRSSADRPTLARSQQLGIDSIRGPDAATEIPGVHEHVRGQRVQDVAGPTAGAVEVLHRPVEVRRRAQRLTDRRLGREPARRGVVPGPLGPDPERPQEQELVEPDDVLDERSRVPVRTCPAVMWDVIVWSARFAARRWRRQDGSNPPTPLH